MGVARKQSQYRLSLDAAGAAFWLVIAMFPAMIAVITIFGLVVDPNKIAADVGDIAKRSPNSLGAVLAAQAQQVAANDAGSLSIGLVVSLVATLWSVSSGGYAMFRAIRQAYALPPQSYLVARARAFAAAIAAVIGLGVLVGLGRVVFDWTDTLAHDARIAVTALAIPVVLLLFTGFVMWTYRYSIAAPTAVRSLLPGAVLSALAVALLAVGVALFGSSLTNYQAIYGALTGIIVALLSVYTVMYVLLLCAVFNQQWAPVGIEQRDPDAPTLAP
jgi:membrane protein